MIVRWTEEGNLHVDEGEREYVLTVLFHGIPQYQRKEKLVLLQQVLEQAGRTLIEPSRPRILQ